jgi:gas vesicle protein
MNNNDRIYYSHNAQMAAMRKITGLTLLCLAFGLGIGSVLALLFAPASGSKTRHDLVESAEPMVKRLEEQFTELRKNVEDRLKQL